MNYEGVDQAAYREKRLAAFAAALRAMGLARAWDKHGHDEQ